jgi:MFS family permease
MGIIGIALINLVFFIVTLFVPFYLEDYLGLEPAQMGRYLSLIPIATLIVAPLSGRYSDRHGARRPVLGGLGLAALGFALMAAIGFSGSVRDIVIGLLMLGIAGGMFNSPLMSLMMGSVSTDLRGIAAGLGSLARNLGFLLGTSIGSFGLSMLFWRYGGVELMRTSQQAGLSPETVSFDAFQFAMRGLMVLCCLVCIAGIALLARLPNQPFTTGSTGRS